MEVFFMTKKGLHNKFLVSALSLALAATGTGIPQTAQAASYPATLQESGAMSWSSDGAVSVHDPSIVLAYEDAEGKTYPENAEGRTKVYYIFGSHMAWAKSHDLKNWEHFTNNINTDYSTIFKENGEWSASGDADYNLSGNLWAPDVIWNDTMGKWCMYMSINGVSWNSSIVLLTSDTLDGNWDYIDTIIYSGFNEKGTDYDFTRTDYQKVTGESSLANRYIKNAQSWWGSKPSTWNSDYGAHAIDPCVLYEGDKLYMTYGSWSGGIYMIELDEETGLRDYNVTYETVANKSDAYMGIQLGGGHSSSGEASYIQKIGDYYYLFITNGGLTAAGGYNVRVFRSEKLAGPYVDEQGNSAIYERYTFNIQNSVGSRLMSYYQWSWLYYGEVAQGHNSAFVDDDGKAYIVYHTRSNIFGEVHQVRVHQLYQNENGWLVESPMVYSGETIKTDGYALEDIVGTYEIILQGATSYSDLEVNTGVDIELLEDGTISCSSGDFKGGTWDQTEGSCNVEIKLDDVTYHGVFTTATMEGIGEETLCFTVVADQTGEANFSARNLWGVKLPNDFQTYMSSRLKLTQSKASVKVGKTKKIKVYDKIAEQNYPKYVKWKSSNKKIATVTQGGKIKGKKAGSAKITATVNGKTMTCKVTVKKK